MISEKHTSERGAVNASLITTISLSVLAIGLIALSIWLFVQYSAQKSDVDSKVSVAVAEAKRSQAETDETKFAQREKEPNRQFVGPDDYGRLTFSYPKTWSVYVAKDVSGGGDYAAYLNPVSVPPVVSNSSQRYALRVLIQNEDYNKVVATYDARIKSGDLKSSAVSANGLNGTRIDGSFTKDLRGAVVIYKVRDKTVSVFTDADTFKPDFETIIQTIKVNE